MGTSVAGSPGVRWMYDPLGLQAQDGPEMTQEALCGLFPKLLVAPLC